MWKCHKCGKPVYFAERKQSLGYDWHPECLRCEECGKRLNPGQHAEHKGVPYCHVPCYGALFGPQLFGHGTRVESHKSFGVQIKGSPRAAAGPALPRDHLESKLKVYNQFFNNKSHEIRSREVNDRLVLEGALRVYWGVQGVIHLKEDDDQRTVITVRKRNSCRYVSGSGASEAGDSESTNGQEFYARENVDANDTGIELSTSSIIDGDSTDISLSESMSYDTCSLSEDAPSIEESGNSSSKEVSPDHQKSLTLPSKLEVKNLEWNEIDDLLQVERKHDASEKLYQTMPLPLSSSQNVVDNLTDNTTTTDSTTSTLTKDFDPSLYLSTSENFPQDSSEYVTPSSTLKNVDYDEFKKKMQEEFILNSNQLQHVNDGTLKSNQPIDPSRINDSLKLYSENMMSKSYSAAEQSPLRVCPPSQYQTIASIDPSKVVHDYFNASTKNYLLQKSGSASSRITTDTAGDTMLDRGALNRSKSGPNWFDNNNYSDSDNCETLKPSTVRKNQEKFHIQMDCYNNDRNGGSFYDGGGSGLSPNSAPAAPVLTPTSQTDNNNDPYSEDGVVMRHKKTGSTAIKRRSGNKRSRAKLKRRCSINGHFYDRETSFFTPPRGSQMSVWVTSLVNTQDVITLILEKYKVESRSENFALFVVRDNGEQKRLKDDDYPLIARIMLGPHEDVARLFLMDSQSTSEISCEVAQFLNLSIPECRSILDRYNDEMDREAQKIKERYAEMKRRIIQRMETLKVRL